MLCDRFYLLLFKRFALFNPLHYKMHIILYIIRYSTEDWATIQQYNVPFYSKKNEISNFKLSMIKIAGLTDKFFPISKYNTIFLFTFQCNNCLKIDDQMESSKFLQ